MGSPDPRQIDGLGGADPLTSKVAVVRRSERPGVDVDYLFLQVFVDQPIVTDAQNCGNILAGVGPFAIERGLVEAKRRRDRRSAIFMENTGQVATATIATPNGRVTYEGDARIDGVPGSAAPVPIEFRGYRRVDLRRAAADRQPGRRGRGRRRHAHRQRHALRRHARVRSRHIGRRGAEGARSQRRPARQARAIRLAAGPLMNLGDVTEIRAQDDAWSRPPGGGAIATRTFIPHRCHASIGVLGAVSVATACLLPAGPAAELAKIPPGTEKTLSIEHPSGEMSVVATMADDEVKSVAVLRTARKLFDGIVFG
jgi:4-oxalomesaconate tautomerase